MDQERVGIKIADVYKLTGELFLKSLYYAIEEGYQKVKLHTENKVFSDKAKWNQFLATKETKHFETFMTSEINSERLEEYLKSYNVGFAIQDNKDGTSTIAIDAKNVQALEESFKAVINDLTDPTKAESLTKKLAKTPKNMSLNEKIAYHKKQMQAEIAAKAKEKGVEFKKSKTKGEKEI